MANHNATRTQRCSSLDVYTAKTPFRTHNGMKMAPPATTIHHSNTDVTAVTPTPSRNPNRSLASNTGQSERELKRTRASSNSDVCTGKECHPAPPSLPHAPSSLSSYNESAALNASKRDDDSSLGTLAIRFFNLLKTYGEQELDLNEAVLNLGVQKRRIYDVTCVMEGCGMIEKRNKNQVANCCKESESEVFQKKNLQNEIKDLKSHEQSLDNYIESLQKIVKQYTVSNESASFTSKLFITKCEIASMENYVNDTVLAIRAPPKTSVYVPHPDQVTKPGMRKFRIEMMCPDKNSVYIHEVKCGNKMGRERTRNLAEMEISRRQVGRKAQINSGHCIQNSNNMPSRALEMSKYPNPMHSSHGPNSMWPKNRGGNYPIQEQRKVVRDESRLPSQVILSTLAVQTNCVANRVPSGLIVPKNHMRPPQMPSTDSFSRTRCIRPLVESSNNIIDRSTGTVFPGLKRKHDWSKNSPQSIGLRPTPRNIKREGNLETGFHGERRNSRQKPIPPSPLTDNKEIGRSSTPTHNEVSKYSNDSAKLTSLCELTPVAPREQVEVCQHKESYSAKIITDTVACGPSPNTRNHELLNAPLDSPLQFSPGPFRNSRASADRCPPATCSPFNAGNILSPFSSVIDDCTAEDSAPNFFSCSPLHRAS